MRAWARAFGGCWAGCFFEGFLPNDNGGTGSPIRAILMAAAFRGRAGVAGASVSTLLRRVRRAGRILYT